MTLEVRVQDSGIGIATDEQDQIFEKFKQTKGQNQRKYGGTGLGLAITKQLTEILGGTIHLESTLGQGTTFILSFHHVQIVHSTSKIQEKLILDTNFNQFQKSKILLVDDVAFNLSLIAAYFSNSPHQLFFAYDGKQAIEIVKQHQPDVILLDLVMPNLDGYEVIKQLKENPETRNIPIIILTASMGSKDKSLIESSCQGFLLKPVSRSDLVIGFLRFALVCSRNYSIF